MYLNQQMQKLNKLVLSTQIFCNALHYKTKTLNYLGWQGICNQIYNRDNNLEKGACKSIGLYKQIIFQHYVST